MKANSRNTSLDHINFSVRNFSESTDWYEKVFGFEIAERGFYEGRPWGALRNGDSVLCIYESPHRTSPNDRQTESFHRIYHFGLRIHDREAWEKTLRDQNLTTYYGSPRRYPHSISWYVTDPTGHIIEVALWDQNQVQFS